MSALLDSSVLVAALASDEPRHAECLTLLLKGGNFVYSHALLETFSTLTGGKLGVRVTADFAVRMLSETVLPRVAVIELSSTEIIAALAIAQSRGVRGGGIYDHMHLVAAIKAKVSVLHTLNMGDFLHLRRDGDPEIEAP